MKNWQQRVEGWAAERNLIKGSTPEKQLSKLIEEVGELAKAIRKVDHKGVMDGVGDVVVVAAIIASQIEEGLDRCQEHAWNEIKDRKGKMIDGVFVKEEDLPKCGACEGEGRVPVENEHKTDRGTKWERTDTETVELECPLCDGSGTVH